MSFTHHGVLPLQPDFPVWSGSAVVDGANTAGYGAGAVAALAFTEGDTGIFLYTDGGPATFTDITIRAFGTAI